MTFWWWRCSSTKDYSPRQLVGWNQNVLHFDLKKHHCSRLAMSFFNVYIMHHDVTSTRCLNIDQLWYDPVEEERNLSSAFFQTSWIWSGVDVLRSECNLSLSEIDFFVLLYCNTQSYCIRERLVSLSYVRISIKVTLFFVFLYVMTSSLYWKSDK